MSAGRTASGGPDSGNILVRPDGDPRLLEDYCIARGSGPSRGRGRGGPRGVPIVGGVIAKPVIYLYPPSPIEACVKISLIHQWKFSALYPVPAKGAIRDGEFSHSAEWLVSSSPDGMMKVKGTSTEVAYLFWEAEPNTSVALLESPPASRPASPNEPRSRPGFVPGTTKCSPQDSILLSIDMVPFYLDEALLSLGLHVEARTSFISYWLPSMLNYKFIALRFLPQIDYEASAPLEINPRPDVVTRVYMLFQGIAQEELDGWQEAQERLSEGVDIWKTVVGVNETRQQNKDLFRVLEWGGMEVFERFRSTA
ncbi:hypothetical protein M407DRAFT_215958 [Tulasnella calospora MUT 4182]|uniref:Uncharacterized protein n=1 Tax=Tulasnella calospora MUT 4182 TaxID=1051891 RepID=A0A0C3QIZ2_9AGAM|nr:hypothetical protein M407DRAFT_215958 [Tulasnella calospora MUT 4182]